VNGELAAMLAGERVVRICGECGREFRVDATAPICLCRKCAEKYAPVDKPSRVLYVKKGRTRFRIEWRGTCPAGNTRIRFDPKIDPLSYYSK